MTARARQRPVFLLLRRSEPDNLTAQPHESVVFAASQTGAGKETLPWLKEIVVIVAVQTVNPSQNVAEAFKKKGELGIGDGLGGMSLPRRFASYGTGAFIEQKQNCLGKVKGMGLGCRN